MEVDVEPENERTTIARNLVQSLTPSRLDVQLRGKQHTSSSVTNEQQIAPESS